MRLRTVIRLGTILSVGLFGIAVAFYAFTQLDTINYHRDTDLYSLVPSSSISVLDIDNVSAFLNDLPTLNYSEELEQLHSQGLYSFLLESFKAYVVDHAHELNSQIGRMLISFHHPTDFCNQVIYLSLDTEGEQLLIDMLQEYASSDFSPKVEKYRNEMIYIYPVEGDEFLATYSGTGFQVISQQKHLVEQVIDARLDGTSMSDDQTVLQILQQKKTNRALTLYTHASAIPLLEPKENDWCECNFYMNSDVFYLTGETLVADSCAYRAVLANLQNELLQLTENRLFVSVGKDSLENHMNRIYEEDTSEHNLFKQSIVNLSKDADFTLVVDMQNLIADSSVYETCLPSFILNHPLLFRPFIVSAQYFWNNNKLSYIWMFTYKN